jgi:lipopolysaccharide transport system permease protein
MKLKYKRSVLGIAWSLVNPVAQLLVLGFVFRYILPLNIPHYLSFLFVGLLGWGWLHGALIAGATAIVDNGPLIKRPRFPAPILPVAVVSTHLIHFLFALPILLLAVVMDGQPLTVALFAFPVVLAIQFLLALACVYVISPLQVTYRDTQYLLSIFLMLMFYLTPVFYDVSSVPKRFRFLYRLNPMDRVVEAYRDILLSGRPPRVPGLAYVFLVSIAMLGYGYARFRQVSHAFAEEL